MTANEVTVDVVTRPNRPGLYPLTVLGCGSKDESTSGKLGAAMRDSTLDVTSILIN